MFAPDDHLTLFADDSVAIWSLKEKPTTSQADEPVGEVEILVADRSGRPRRRTVTARRPSVGRLVEALASVTASSEVSPSVAAAGGIVRLAIGAIAEGRVVPTPDRPHDEMADAHDRNVRGKEARNELGPVGWRVAPWRADDAASLEIIADRLPPELMAEVLETRPLRVRPATEIVARFADSVATCLVATPASHSRAMSCEPHALEALARRVAGDGPILVARLTLATEPDLFEATEGTETAPDGPTLNLSVRHRVDRKVRHTAAQIWAAPDRAEDLGVDEPDLWLLTRLRELGRVWSPLARLLSEPAPSELGLSDDDVADLILEGASALAGHEVEVLLPRDLVKALSLTVKVSPQSSDATGSGTFALDSICETQPVAALDGEPLTADELDTLVAAEREVVMLRGSFVRVDARLAGQLARSLTGAEALGLALAGQLGIGDEAIAVEASGGLGELLARIEDASRRRHTDNVDSPDGVSGTNGAARPDGLARTDGTAGIEPEAGTERHTRIEGIEAELRPYQSRGVDWLDGLTRVIGGAVLADDMGLGKTLQMICLHALRTGPPTLVVCPASLVPNWLREFERFAPGIGTHRYHGPNRTLGELAGSEPGEDPTDGPPEVVVTTYATLRIDAAQIREIEWGMVVADEAQNVKNHRSQNSIALRSVKAEVRCAVTGTPVENRLDDLWSLMDWTVPGLLGRRTAFTRMFAKPIERDGDTEIAEQLAAIVRPFVLRRTKSDPSIVPDLPDRTEIDHLVDPTPEQAALYRAFTSEVLEQIEESEGIARKGLVLKLLSGLKQICDHPALWLGDGGPTAGRSAKLTATEGLIEEMTEAGDRVLVFTQYVKMGEILVDRLGQIGQSTAFFHGGLSSKVRQELVDDFQAGAGPEVMIISIKAGGTGLNLTSANHVIHYDRWWNPAVENQASDRAWRIGQTKSVFVHRLSSVGTLEEKIADELERKRHLADSVISPGEGWIGELDDRAIRSLVELSGGGS